MNSAAGAVSEIAMYQQAHYVPMLKKEEVMPHIRLPRHGKRSGSAILKHGLPLALVALLAACSGNSDDTVPSAPPVPVTAGAIVTSFSEPGQLQLYAGQEKSLTLGFTTSDGVAASKFVLSPPQAGLPAGWSMPGADARCARVAAAGACEAKLSYAPAAAAPLSTLTLPYIYQDSAGKPGTGSVTITYSALAANAAVATVSPAGPVRGVTGTAASVALTFTTNDGSAASGLHMDSDLSSLPAGWTSASPGLDCARFSTGDGCKLALTYAPVATTLTATLELRYHYTDSSGKAQAATTAISYSAAAPNTVTASASPAGRILVKPGSSQDIVLSFLPSDGVAAGAVRMTSDLKSLPAGWSVKASTLPCAQAGAEGTCKLTLAYAPDDKQPAGRLNLEYAYANAVGENLAGKASLDYASHDYRAYVADIGGVVNGVEVGGVRQCELDGAGLLTGCVKAEGTWPVRGTSNIVVSGSHAYVTSVFGGKPIVLCDIAADGALVNCAGASPVFEQASHLVINDSGAYVLARSEYSFQRIIHCTVAPDGKIPASGCQKITGGYFPHLFPAAMTNVGTMVYVAGEDLETGEGLGLQCPSLSLEGSCTLVPRFPAHPPVQSMSTGQARDGGHLYLALAVTGVSPYPPGISKCDLNVDGSIKGCGPALVPPGLDSVGLTLVTDIKIVGSNAYLVAGNEVLERQVYLCPLNPDNGDFLKCGSAGPTDAMANYGLGFR
jgi:hypothetical protein